MRIAETPQWKLDKIVSSSPITIDGMRGHELVADATNNRGKKIEIYEVVLVVDGAYILITGIVGKEQAREFTPVFRKMAKSLKRNAG